VIALVDAPSGVQLLHLPGAFDSAGF
jgi:hypothetical protein